MGDGHRDEPEDNEISRVHGFDLSNATIPIRANRRTLSVPFSIASAESQM
jgi:hypothetical protein